MRIAVPNEVQDNENRVGMTPGGARALVEAGHEVLIEALAGAGAGFPDDAYRAAGAEIAPDASTAWAEGELVVKVKQPTEEECELFRRGGAFFGYTHTETRPWLTRAFLEREMTAISFERVRLEDGSLPLLAPMSRIAGHMAVLIGAQLLQTVHGGPGVLVGNMPGTGPTGVVIIGGGVAGEAAARVAVALGAEVTIFELRDERRQELARLLPAARVQPPDEPLVADAVVGAWLVINGATVPEGADVHVVTREMVRSMPDGAVIVDVTADLEGAIETSIRKTTHSEPTFVEEGVVHYVVPNIPGVVPRTATLALESATLPYAAQIAALGVGGAIAADPALAAAVLCLHGEPVAEDIAAQVR
ncbi:MAG: alanine dehydrogenase [Armatimonadota bacterium]|jgi:alanine dehydrogenase